ncbi:MAG TPA: NfeD family protein [Capillimicrobium sp.]|nr:NfeD family protein [Capillimicrobium sp.]
MAGLGIALFLGGVVLVVAEAHVASAGVLGVTGTVAAVAGAAIAVDAAGGGVALAAVIAVLVALILGGFLAVALLKVGRVLTARPRSGREALVGHRGVARAPDRVLVDGALWTARPCFDEEPVDAGDPIVVTRVDGLTLTVRKAEPWELTT